MDILFKKLEKINKISLFDFFIEFFFLTLFLDIFFNLFYNENILTFSKWNTIFENQHFGNCIIFFTCYGMCRISVPVFIMHFVYKAIFMIKKQTIKQDIENNENYISISKAKKIAIEENNTMLETRIKEKQENSRKFFNLSSISFCSILFCIISLFIKNSIIRYLFKLPSIQKHFFILIGVIFIISLCLFIWAGYYEYWNDKIYCPISKYKKD